ncbi:MAG: signal peptidase II [Vicinamibacterales bacterium]
MTDTPVDTGAQAAPTAADERRRDGWALALVAAIVVLDQVTKAAVRASLPLHAEVPIVPGFLSITHVRNTGAAFGIFNAADFPYKAAVLAVVATAALLGIAAYAARLSPHQRAARLGLALILGGAIGNLIDRVTAGYVVDFVDVYWRDWHFWAFNVADSAITVGVVGMALDMLGFGTNVSKAR